MKRYFGAVVIRLISRFDESDDSLFDRPLLDVFLPWGWHASRTTG
ncbi:hypothetical protein [Streptomyces sp. ISL-94]|nr:hypothetical protein [Streptomyces sp. ISL-94]